MSEVIDHGRLLDSYRSVNFYDAPFSSIAEEGRALFLLNWLETAVSKADPLFLNWPAYVALEQRGQEACIVARDAAAGGSIAGYAVYLIAPSLHFSLMLGIADIYYVSEAYRRGWLPSKLFRVAEAMLRARGVQEVYTGLKCHVRPGRGRTDLEPFFRRLGYRPMEKLMRKRIAV